MEVLHGFLVACWVINTTIFLIFLYKLGNWAVKRMREKRMKQLEFDFNE